jgi:signal transduction histidine kinase
VPRLGNLSITRKLTLIIMASSATALLLTGLGLIVYDVVTFQRAMAANLSSIAAVVGSNTAAAVVFQDVEAARESLRALRARHSIVSAFAYKKDGTPFAGYVRDRATAAPSTVPAGFSGERFTSDSVEVFEPIRLGAEVVGAIAIKSDLHEIQERLWRAGQIMLMVFAVSLFVAYGVSSLLQRSVSGPILALAELAESVSARQDYAVRAQPRSGDEIGVLVQGFNHMLGQIQKRDGELQKTHGELEQRIAELQRSNGELEQFAYVASHDLQEPLRMITGYTQLLAKRYKGRLDPDADSYIGFAVDGAKRMQALIEALLNYSRVGTRGKPKARTDCEAVLQNTLAGLQLAIQQSGAVVTHDPLPNVMADESQISQLLQNLIGNAIKFRNAESPRVHISCKRKSDAWLFSVKDNGIGIDPQYWERIFVIFQRLHTREEYAGTGIGLAICKKIVERHGGTIWVNSEANKGATFYFTLAA